MPDVEFLGKSFSVDEDGFIDDFTKWTPEWVQYVKKEEGIEELSAEHWQVINVLQDYYKKNPLRYKYYKYGCGRAQRVESLWGKS